MAREAISRGQGMGAQGEKVDAFVAGDCSYNYVYVAFDRVLTIIPHGGILRIWKTEL